MPILDVIREERRERGAEDVFLGGGTWDGNCDSRREHWAMVLGEAVRHGPRDQWPMVDARQEAW